MDKKYYISPAMEELQGLLYSFILDASGDGERDGYPDGGSFDW